MTDITELAQREKFEAWAEGRCALPWGYLKNRRTNTGYFSKHDYTNLWAAWKAAGAELVEALEKAQQEIASANRVMEAQDSELITRRQYIAELESRTVMLPPTIWYEHDDYAQEIAVLEKSRVLQALTAAGTKWEAE